MSEVRFIYNILKEYPDMLQIIVLKSPQPILINNAPKRPKELVDPDDFKPRYGSLKRTKNLVKDIVLCNDFELFCTFTFDPKKVDSFSFPACYSKMSTWLHHQRNLSREQHVNFKYLIVPEQHKSGRWHFHALISGYTGSLRPANTKTGTSRLVYNVTSFRSGFTTAVRIDSKEGVSEYVSKYITKDFIKMFNQRRFFCSNNLIRPKKSTNTSVLRDLLPLFKRIATDTPNSTVYSVSRRDAGL